MNSRDLNLLLVTKQLLNMRRNNHIVVGILETIWNRYSGLLLTDKRAIYYKKCKY